MKSAGARRGMRRGGIMPPTSTETRKAQGLRVLVREVRCGDGVAARELKVFCHRRQACVPVHECTGCTHCMGFSLDPTGRRSMLQCDWQKPASEPPPAPSTAEMKSLADRVPVSEIMTKDVVCVTDDLSLGELTRVFLDRGISGVPVVDALGRAIGVVSKTDLVRQAYEEPATAETRDSDLALEVYNEQGAPYELGAGFHDVETTRGQVRDVMTPVAYTLRASTSIAQAAALMAFEGIHRLPITADSSSEIIGLLSALDVLRWLGEQDAYLARHDEEVC